MFVLSLICKEQIKHNTNIRKTHDEKNELDIISKTFQGPQEKHINLLFAILGYLTLEEKRNICLIPPITNM